MKLEKLPEIGSQLSVQMGKHIAFVCLEYDEFSDNPLKDSAWYGYIISLERRHSSYDAEQFSKSYKNKDCVVLSYFEHGDCIWAPAGKLPAGANCPWDSVNTAGLWLPNECIMRELDQLGKPGSKRRRDRVEKLAEEACKVFTEWCNGNIYAYSVEVFEARYAESGELLDLMQDYRHDDSIVNASCGGFYLSDSKDEEYFLGEINQHLKDLE